MKIGYARVSTGEQSLEIQTEQLKKIGCEKIFQEKSSGKTVTSRKSIREMINYAREGDVIHVTKVDRLARNTVDALNIADELMIKNVGLVCHDLSDVNINSDIGRIIYTTISAFAELERKRILTRCNEGREKAKAEGRHLGRFKNEDLHNNILQYFDNGMNKNLIAKTLGCSRTTVYRVLNL